jgi:hypothetical protein
MAKQETRIKHQRTIDSNQKVTDNGDWVIMSDGSRFRRTVLPSFAEPTKLQEEPQDAIEDFDAMQTDKKQSPTKRAPQGVTCGIVFKDTKHI